MCSTKSNTFSSTSAQFTSHSASLSHVFGRLEPYNVTFSVVFICIYIPSFLPLVHDFSSLGRAPRAVVARPYSRYRAQPPKNKQF